MCAMCKVFSFSIFIFLLFSSVESESLIWNLTSRVFVFGEDVQLSCSGSACQPNTIKKWIGGPNYKLLCYDGYSSDSSKYEILVNKAVAEFGLIIKNVTIEDTLHRYTCSCGLQQYTDTLNLEGVGYIHPPDVQSIITKERDGKYQFEIQMNVYPLPDCNITYKGRDIPTLFNIHTYKGGKIRLYNVSVNNQIGVKQKDCKGNIHLSCNIGERPYSTLIQESDGLCKEKQHTEDNYITVCVITVTVLMIVLGAFCLYMYKSKADMRRCVHKTLCCNQNGSENSSPISQQIPIDDLTPMIVIHSQENQHNVEINVHSRCTDNTTM